MPPLHYISSSVILLVLFRGTLAAVNSSDGRSTRYRESRLHGSLRASAAQVSAPSPSARWLSLIATRRSQATDDVGSCSCDCCLSSVGLDQSQKTVCSPRSGASALGEDGGCASVCAADPDTIAALGATTDQVDYSTYCPRYCQELNGKVGVVCVSQDTWNQVQDAQDQVEENADTVLAEAAENAKKAAEEAAEKAQSASAGAAPAPSLGVPAPASAPAAASTQPQLLPEELGLEPSLSDLLFQATARGGSEVRIAKTLTARAREHAINAGKAARRARIAYEEILHASQDAAATVSKAVYDGLFREAQEQATQAEAARKHYEAEAQSKAYEAAVNAATVYQDAWKRDQVIASAWDAHAEQLKSAAVESGRAAKQAAELGAVAREQGSPWKALQASGQARRAEAESIEFERRAVDAGKEAADIRDMKSWYHSATQKASADALKKTLPPGVEAPILAAK